MSDNNAPDTAQLMEQILYEVKRVVVGQDRFLERVMVAMLAQGHLLVEGVPGLAKTRLIPALGADGAARVEIDLASVNTGVEIRDERMREIFFQVADFPSATVTAQLDPQQFAALDSGMVGSGGLGLTDWLVIAMIPLIGVLLAVVTARITIALALRDML